MDAKTLIKYLNSLPQTATGYASIMIRGAHGIGKSAIVRQWADSRKLNFIDIRLGQRDVGDIIGMPALIDLKPPKRDDTPEEMLKWKRFKHIIADLMRPAFEEPSCLFCDEYNRGTKDVQQAMFEVVLDRRMNGRDLHPETWVFAACNSDLDTYTVTETDPAFLSRFSVIDFEPSPKEWWDWGKETGNLCEEVLEVFVTAPELSDPPKKKLADTYNNPHPNRRSWTLFSNWFDKIGRNLSGNLVRDVAATFIGAGAAETFGITLESFRQRNQTHQDNETNEIDKIELFAKKMFLYKTLETKEAKSELSSWNPSELEGLANHVVIILNRYKHFRIEAMAAIVKFADAVQDEIMTQIWIGLNVDLKNRLLRDYKKEFSKYTTK